MAGGGGSVKWREEGEGRRKGEGEEKKKGHERGRRRKKKEKEKGSELWEKKKDELCMFTERGLKPLSAPLEFIR